MTKNLPAVQRSGFVPWVEKIPLEEGLATHSSILAWRIPWTEEPDGCSPWGRKESDTNEAPKQHYTQNKFYIMSD